MKSRLLAATIIHEVQSGVSLLDTLEPHLLSLDDGRDRAWVQAVVFGVCRHYYSLHAILTNFLSNPTKLQGTLIEALLLVGLYQLIHMRIQPFAVVAETVNAAKKLKKPWAAGLVNGVLRSYLRHIESGASVPLDSLEAQYDHPIWWIERTKKDWPLQFSDILTADQAHPPMTLRVNLKHISREKYIDLCREQEIACEPCQFSLSGVRLLQPLRVALVPGFMQGLVSVQDEAGQLAATLLAANTGDCILDACAAPGSKFTHLLEHYDHVTVVGLEKEKARAALIGDNLSRLQLSATYTVGNALDMAKIYKDRQFDRILLDVPCSCSGVLRRHPDIKLLRNTADINRFANEQYKLLTHTWPQLKSGGTLLYATCSVFLAENTAVIARFLRDEPSAIHDVIDATWGHACDYGRQILPGEHGMDGFYYARIKKAE